MLNPDLIVPLVALITAGTALYQARQAKGKTVAEEGSIIVGSAEKVVGMQAARIAELQVRLEAEIAARQVLEERVAALETWIRAQGADPERINGDGY